jgi:Leucine-rich repeat (LRR) protein/GTPase SAR1 family protein
MTSLISQSLKKINYFRSQSEHNYVFACQAAIPLVLTPDLLYQLWNNFKVYQYVDEPLESFKIPSIAISDFLLSDLCREVGFEIFEMEKEIRDLLLTDLVFMLGEKRKNTIAKFLEEYAENEYRLGHRQDLRDLHQYTALSILSPSKMEEKIIEKINSTTSDSEKIRHLLLHNNLMPQGIESTLKEISSIFNYTNLSPILIEAQNEDDIDVLSIVLPSVLKNKVRQVKTKKNVDLEEKITTRVADDIIHEVKEKRLTQLDLGNCGLTELPLEVLECTWVEELILSSDWWDYELEKNEGSLQHSQNKGEANKITFLPPNLLNLTTLKKLVINDNQISNLSPIAHLTNLQILHCYSNQIADLTPIEHLTNLQILNCSYNQIADLSPIANLSNLQQLYCSSNQTSDLSPIASLTNLQQLHCYRNQIADLAPIEHLTNLQQLYCSSNQIADLVPIEHLTNLQILNCTYNQIADLTPIEHLTNLQQLDCNNNQIADLVPIEHLTNLQILQCSYNQIADLASIKHLTNLQILYCSSNQIADLAPIEHLTNLQQLYCDSNQIADLAPIEHLTNLQQLDCTSNQITDLAPIEHLTNLQQLDCSYNRIIDLAPIEHLTNLQQLNCKSNQIADLAPIEHLANLQRLYCSDNQIVDLTPIVGLIKKGRQVKWSRVEGDIRVGDNPLTNPPIEIVKQGNEAILRYFEEKARSGTQKVNEARLLLVGQGGAGKTTLKEKLRDRKADMPAPDATTKTIHIEPLLYKDGDGADFVLQVWDFGGQNIQKYAHQFFMSDSVVYALLSNTRDQNPNFQYWLNIIEMLGKDSPFFIVQNEKDGHAEPLRDITQIQDRFPDTFQSVEQVNLKNAETDPRFDLLERRLLYAATQLPHTRKEYPLSFIHVRRALENLSKTQQTIPFKQFKDLCKAEGISDPALMNDYARTFTYLGVALYFADDLHLKTQIFLRPKWIIDALFGLLYAPIVEAQNGRFSASDAEAIWTGDEYNDMHGVLLQLMLRFKLCYELPSKQGYIVPQRLPTRMQPFVPPPDATHIVYRYRFLPSGILTQLTCTLYTRIEKDKAWNDAVLFSTKSGQGRVFVRENSSADSIEVFGYGQDKADLLNMVVDAIDEVHDTSKFGNLKVEKLVPCPCPICTTARTKQEPAEFFDYNFLMELLRDGETESDRCKLSKRKFPIRDILKASNIRGFKIKQVKEYLANDRVEDALLMLRGQFPEDSEIVVQLSRINRHGRMDRMGQMERQESSVERNKIIKGVMDMLNDLGKED